MTRWIFLVGGLILLAIGGWTVTHPNGGYRPVGGVGSSFSPSTRRGAGIALMAFALLVVGMGLAGSVEP